jgi:hypothetical protein
MNLYDDSCAQGRSLGGDQCRKQRANAEGNRSAHRQAGFKLDLS